MPTYVLAYVYSYLLGFGGPVEHLWQLVAGPQARIFSPHSYWGATLVMALDTFPFVYLLSRSALLSMNVSFEEVARASGVSRLSTLWRVTLPLMRPSIAAGVALVILYVVSDFGAVSLLRYQTLTYAVFQQMTGRSDNTAASILSLLLVGARADFPDHGTVVPTTEPVLSDHRPLPGSATAPIWLARHHRHHRLSRIDRRRGLRAPSLAIDSMEPLA